MTKSWKLMKLLVIGQSVIDHIFTIDQNVTKPGGIYYTCLGLKLMKSLNDSYNLITNFSKTSKEYFNTIFNEFDLSYSTEVEKLPNVNLYLHDNKERCEQYDDLTQKLTLPADLDYSIYDGILLNMITGFDISLDDLFHIRANFFGPIYLDVHTLARGIGENHHRNFRKIPDADKWLSNVDIVQANESEFLTLTEYDNEEMTIIKIFENKSLCLIVTRGSKGATLYNSTDGKINRIDVKATLQQGMNSIGCGDIFGAIFFYTYLKTNDLKESLKIANSIAGFSAGCADSNDILEFIKC